MQGLQGFGIDFEWTVFAAYDVGKVPDPMFMYMPQLIGSGEPLTTRPLAIPNLYLRLAESEPTVEGHIAFAKKYGLLTDREWELTTRWEQRVQGMRRLVAMVEDKANWDIRNGRYVPYEHPGSFTFRSVPNSETGEMTFNVVPKDLYAALELQCFSHRASGAQIRMCKSCGSLFEAGGASGTRSHKTFCSDKCRYDFAHRSRRGQHEGPYSRALARPLGHRS
jgi:hypothetical protein